MVHSFDVEIAILYGIPAAVFLYNLKYWIMKNAANNKHFYDGRTWSYNSRKALEKLLPYMTSRQIQYTVDKLVEEGIIVTGNYNTSAYDRTLWYAITEKGWSILQNCKLAETGLLNENNENVEPIPNNKPNNKQTDIKPNNKEKEKKENLFSDFADQFSFVENTREDLISTLNDFVEARKERKNPMNEKAVKLLLNKLRDISEGDGDYAIKSLEESMINGWRSVFKLNNYNKQKRAPERRPASSSAPSSDPSSDELADLTAKLAEMGYKFNEAKCEPEAFMLRQAIEYESSLNSYLADGYVVKI